MKQKTCDLIFLCKNIKYSKYSKFEKELAVKKYIKDQMLADGPVSESTINSIFLNALFDLVDCEKITSHLVEDTIKHNHRYNRDSMHWKGIYYTFKNLYVQEFDCNNSWHFVGGFTRDLVYSSLNTLGINIDSWEQSFGCPEDAKEI